MPKFVCDTCNTAFDSELTKPDCPLKDCIGMGKIASKRMHCESCDLIFVTTEEKPACIGCQGPTEEMPYKTKKKTEDEKLCMTPECGKPAKWKGLCQSCYGCAKRIMDNDDVTWEELAKMGLCQIGDKPFYAAYAKKKAELEKYKEPSVQEHRAALRGD